MSSQLIALLFAGIGTVLALPAGAAVDSRYSAHWYGPERSGEGWMLEILNPTQALLYWFTYDEDGGQRWLTAVGAIQGRTIDFPDLVLTTGGQFGPGFDPELVIRERVGAARLEFDNCTSGRLQYSAFDQEQELAFERLSSTVGLDCDGDGGPITDRQAGRSGSWYDPTRSGEGYTLHWMSDSVVLMIWFSYGPDGRQHWMLGVGDLQDDGSLLFAEVHDTRGARFGVDFDPDEVKRRAWGELRLELDCETGSAQFEPVAHGFVAGSYELQRLTQLHGAPCTASDWTHAQWRLSKGIAPRRSELPGVSLGNHIYVAGGLVTLTANTRDFWRYEPDTDTWQRLADLPAARDHAMMAASEDAIYLFGGYTSGPVSAIASNLAWRYDPSADLWSAIAPMPESRAAGGAARIGDHIYLAGGGHGSSLSRYDTRSGAWSTQAIADHAQRDHSALVAHNGELWLLGGRDHFTGGAHSAVRIIDPISGHSRPGPDMPRARSGFAATSVDAGIVVVGGESLWPNLMVGGADLYYAADQQWRNLADPPLTVHGGPAVLHGDRLYLLLGSTEAGTIFNPGRVQILSRP